MYSYIIVNATALDKSGALSILRQFIEYIPENKVKWLIFIPENVNLRTNKTNVRLEPISGVKPMHKRLLWDSFGLNNWLKRERINPIACVSLQNTGFRVSKKGIPHFIYYHQSIPFFNFRWNPIRQKERTLWFYKHIYPFFVKLFLNKDTKIFVQLDFIKKGFARRFRHNENLINVYSPSVVSINNKSDLPVKLSKNFVNLFYPATGHFYKNHQLLYDSLKSTRQLSKLYVTIPTQEPNVISTGVIPFEAVCAMYNECDALVFPSYIETFGLPLIEAAQTGMSIIAADLPYSREVLSGYEGAIFVSHTDVKAWAEAISHIEKGKRYNPIDISSRPGWKELFKDIINSL